MTEKNGDLKYKTDNAIDEAYRRGYEDKAKEIRDGEYTFYEKGLNDAWECARKIVLSEYNGGMPREQFEEIFDTRKGAPVLKNLTVQETMQKIKDYEERQSEKSCENCKNQQPCYAKLFCPAQDYREWQPKQTDDEIKVGDEVYDKYNPYPRVVTLINEQDMADLIDARGNAHSDSVFCLKKTGRHFPQIAEVLEQMRKESK